MISCEVTKRLSLDEKGMTKRLFHHDDKVSVPQRKGASSRDANGMPMGQTLCGGCQWDRHFANPFRG